MIFIKGKIYDIFCSWLYYQLKINERKIYLSLCFPLNTESPAEVGKFYSHIVIL